MVLLHEGILLSHEKERNRETCHNADKPQTWNTYMKEARTGKSGDRRSLVAVQSCGRREQAVTTHGVGGYSVGWYNVLELHSGHGCAML